MDLQSDLKSIWDISWPSCMMWRLFSSQSALHYLMSNLTLLSVYSDYWMRWFWNMNIMLFSWITEQSNSLIGWEIIIVFRVIVNIILNLLLTTKRDHKTMKENSRDFADAEERLICARVMFFEGIIYWVKYIGRRRFKIDCCRISV